MNLKRRKAFAALSAGNRLKLAVLNVKLKDLPKALPHSLFLGLTGRCQLKCSHCRCRQGHKSYSPGRDMPYPLALKALKAAADLGIPRVIFEGGEPALYPALPRLTAAASRLGLFSELDTNGLRLLDKKFLASLRAAGLCSVRISLHSGTPAGHEALAGKGTFSKAVAAIAAAKRAGLLTYISSCVFPRGVSSGETEKLLSFAEKAGVHGVRMMAYSPEKGVSGLPVRLSGRLARLAPDGYARTCVPPGKTKCAASAGRQLHIDARGVVMDCPYATTPAGSFTKTDLAEIIRVLRRGKRSPGFPCQRAG